MNKEEIVYICSPYRGDVVNNITKAKKYCRFASKLGFIPFAPHLFYTQFLSDDDPIERFTGSCCGLEMLKRACDQIWIFADSEEDISEGMKEEIKIAKKNKIECKYFTTTTNIWKDD